MVNSLPTAPIIIMTIFSLLLLLLPPKGYYPGWPRQYYSHCSSPVSGGISFVDLDGDQRKEILFNIRYSNSMDTLYAFHHTGSLLWTFTDNSWMEYPAYHDINGDGVIETYVCTNSGIWGLSTLGEILHGFPRYISGKKLGPTIADLNNDGRDEIIFISQLDTYCTLYAVDDTGGFIPGWPVFRPGHWALYSHPLVADIDRDNTLEIVVAGLDSLYVFNHDGSVQPGWPVGIRPDPDWCPGQGVLVDIDEDGFIEIIIANYHHIDLCGYLHVFRYDGAHQPNWPKFFPDYCDVGMPPMNFIALGDIDQDRATDIYLLGRAFDKNGHILPGFPISQLFSPYHPLIASVDCTPEPEIISGCGLLVENPGVAYKQGRIDCYGSDGKASAGWPQFVDGVTNLADHNFAIDDIDNDGYSELGYITYPGPEYNDRVFVGIYRLWGDPRDIEWGSAFFDQERTGFYRRR